MAGWWWAGRARILLLAARTTKEKCPKVDKMVLTRPPWNEFQQGHNNEKGTTNGRAGTGSTPAEKIHQTSVRFTLRRPCPPSGRQPRQSSADLKGTSKRRDGGVELELWNNALREELTGLGFCLCAGSYYLCKGWALSLSRIFFSSFPLSHLH